MPSREHGAAVMVLPVKDEALILERSVRAVVAVCAASLPQPWLIIIADNGSTDATPVIAARLAAELPTVRVQSSPVSGKGRAIRAAWESVEADYYFFTDVDLSVDLEQALPRALAALEQGSGIVAGARCLDGARVKRPLLRRIFSLGYGWVAYLITGTRLHDLACGFKGVRASVLSRMLPRVLDQSWFFDSELLLVAEAASVPILELPVSWTEYRYPERSRRVRLLRTSWQYIQGLQRYRARSCSTVTGRGSR